MEPCPDPVSVCFAVLLAERAVARELLCEPATGTLPGLPTTMTCTGRQEDRT
jgi:hypothetical protein